MSYTECYWFVYWSVYKLRSDNFLIKIMMMMIIIIIVNVFFCFYAVHIAFFFKHKKSMMIMMMTTIACRILSAIDMYIYIYMLFVFCCFSVIFACVCYTRNVIINVISIGRQISELMFLWWPAILYSVLNSVCLLMAIKLMMMMTYNFSTSPEDWTVLALLPRLTVSVNV